MGFLITLIRPTAYVEMLRQFSNDLGKNLRTTSLGQAQLIFGNHEEIRNKGKVVKVKEEKREEVKEERTQIFGQFFSSSDTTFFSDPNFSLDQFFLVE